MKSIRIARGKAAWRAWGALWLALMLAPAVVRGGELEDRGLPVGADGVITPTNLGPKEVWPLRIERGTIVCIENAVFISDGHTSYPLNGLAKALTRNDPKDRKPLEDIWLVDEKTLADVRASGVKVQMIRADITPVLTRAVDWCRLRR